MKTSLTSKYGLILKRLPTIQRDALRASLFQFSIDRLVSLKVVTKNLKRPFNFIVSQSVADKELKRLIKLAISQVLKQNPYLSQDDSLQAYKYFPYNAGSGTSGMYFLLPLFDYNLISNRYAGTVNAGPINEKLSKVIVRYIRYINHKISFNRIPLSLNIGHAYAWGLDMNRIYYPGIVVSTNGRDLSNKALLYLLIWNFNEMVQVLTNISRLGLTRDVQNRYTTVAAKPKKSKRD